uniref:Uncharacterized protein n=1 Tax=Rhizophora mucronata TaxID=61149 RepID=A0A2P2PXN0_RHIMU
MAITQCRGILNNYVMPLRNYLDLEHDYLLKVIFEEQT